MPILVYKISKIIHHKTQKLVLFQLRRKILILKGYVKPWKSKPFAILSLLCQPMA